MCSGVVVFVMQTVWVHEMGIRTAQLCSLFVHHVGKGINRACDVFSNCICDFIRGSDKNSVQTFTQGHGLSGINANFGASGFKTEYGIMGKGDDLVHGAVLNSNQAGKNLGGTCRVKLFIHIFGIKNRTGVGL